MLDFYWHAHEMLYGFVPAIMTGFLLTAMSNWTGYVTARKGRLLGLVLVWLMARIALYIPTLGLKCSLGLSLLFYVLVILCLLHAVIKSRIWAHLLPIVVFALYAGSHFAYVFCLLNRRSLIAQDYMLATLCLVVGMISVISMRVLPFFIARRFNLRQVLIPKLSNILGICLPLLLALGMVFSKYPVVLPLTAVLSIIFSFNLSYILFKQYTSKIWTEPMLWVLYGALIFAMIGTPVLVLGRLWQFDLPFKVYDMGVHLITLGGIAAMTLGMMTRSTLGHTGRSLQAPKLMPWAFRLVFLAALLRAMYPLTLDYFWGHMWWHMSATCFILAFCFFLYHFALVFFKKSL
ncbi:hypothetical protein IX83_03250 [Basilea psittacipulmonis DSM 24701]|uniref:NnrS family protein n=2 Tax=Basilea TaxID=1472344 RepID=A0A077DG55_9BURK|nr:hypothetical protein IX83_03250 [Basilea psittacipulmonis DSM 24701]